MTSEPAVRADILVAEDDAEDLFLLLRALRRLDPGLRVEVTRDGVELCESIRSAPRDVLPRLILLDLNLPRCDGREVLGILRRDGYAIPIIVLTTSREPSDHSRALDLGATEVLTKPDEHRSLENLLRGVISRHLSICDREAG